MNRIVGKSYRVLVPDIDFPEMKAAQQISDAWKNREGGMGFSTEDIRVTDSNRVGEVYRIVDASEAALNGEPPVIKFAQCIGVNGTGAGACHLYRTQDDCCWIGGGDWNMDTIALSPIKELNDLSSDDIVALFDLATNYEDFQHELALLILEMTKVITTSKTRKVIIPRQLTGTLSDGIPVAWVVNQIRRSCDL